MCHDNNKPEYVFPLTHKFPYMDRIYDFVLRREYMGQRKPYSDIFYPVVEVITKTTARINYGIFLKYWDIER